MKGVAIVGKSVGAVISVDSENELEVKKSHAAADRTMVPTPIMVQVDSVCFIYTSASFFF